MMYKKVTVSVLIVLLVFNILPSGVYADSKEDTSALIIYENENRFRYDENIVNHLKELLYVFNSDVSEMYINSYEHGDINKYDSVFVINIQNDIVNNQFLEDLSRYENRIYWIGDKIQNYLEYSNKYDIKYSSQNNNITELIYKENEIVIDVGYSFNIVEPSAKSTNISTMSDGYNFYPYIINEKNLYYISRWDLENGYIFEDSLNDFYNIKEFKKGEIFVRIEDVHPFRDTNTLKEVADYLYSENVPFIIALIPTFLDHETKTINTLDMVPEFVKTIQYMQAKGGTVILHGYTHQLGEEEISGEGYEFWDIENNVPIHKDMETYIRDRVLSGLRLCIENGIYPLGFEAPHYAMNIDGYKVLKKYFSTYIGQFQNNNEKFANSTFPYIIRDGNIFNTLIPENLGYVDKDDIFTIEKIKENFKKLSMVRGYTGGFFYHPYLDIDYLKECISFFRDKDVKFLDLKSMHNYVKIDDISIVSKNGKIECSYDESKAKPKKVISKFDLVIKDINDVVIIFILVILVLFFVIFIIFRRINTKKFKRR